MKHLHQLALTLCVGVSLAAIAEPVQPPTQPPSSLPPSSLPPGSPPPQTPSGIDLGRRNIDAPATPANVPIVTNAATREMDRVKNMAKTSESFVAAAAQDGMLEVDLGKLAASKGSNQQIRDFGKHMATDHEKTNAELKKVSKISNVKVPGELDAEHKATLSELRGKSGVAFDAAYAAIMAKDHEKALLLFREASASTGVDSNLQVFAKNTLPTLEEHSSTARQLHAGMAALTNQPRVSTDD